MLQANNSRLESVVSEACKIVSELHIPKDVQPEVKIRKDTGLCKEKVEGNRVQFELNMKITKLQLKMQQSTPTEV